MKSPTFGERLKNGQGYPLCTCSFNANTMFSAIRASTRLTSRTTLHRNTSKASVYAKMSTSTNNSLELNTTHTYDLIVQPSDLASAISSNAEIDKFPRVLATSRMVASMEIAAARVLQPLLSPDQLSVGTSINITHSAPTPVGAKVTAEAKYIGQKGKLYQFEVIAKDEAGEVGRGSHERAIVEIARLENSAKKRGASQ
ncbi:HotDog domain-containing protein [Aspergillus transmontanensis]|uniref:HotDog domain-containing protein n=1 Tax=Aspergillus transmontanensis TaxID=1034304 RepID=A0A5N6VIX4_9EURO|nr:HotDog domain-containing protein [Aspergillus transmontanensis]